MGVFSQFRNGKQVSWELGAIKRCFILWNLNLFFFLNNSFISEAWGLFPGSESVSNTVLLFLVKSRAPLATLYTCCTATGLLKHRVLGLSVWFAGVDKLKNLHLEIPLLGMYLLVLESLGERQEANAAHPGDTDTGGSRPWEPTTGRYHCGILPLASICLDPVNSLATHRKYLKMWDTAIVRCGRAQALEPNYLIQILALPFTGWILASHYL